MGDRPGTVRVFYVGTLSPDGDGARLRPGGRPLRVPPRFTQGLKCDREPRPTDVRPAVRSGGRRSAMRECAELRAGSLGGVDPDALAHSSKAGAPAGHRRGCRVSSQLRTHKGLDVLSLRASSSPTSSSNMARRPNPAFSAAMIGWRRTVYRLATCSLRRRARRSWKTRAAPAATTMTPPSVAATSRATPSGTFPWKARKETATP